MEFSPHYQNKSVSKSKPHCYFSASSQFLSNHLRVHFPVILQGINDFVKSVWWDIAYQACIKGNSFFTVSNQKKKKS